MKFHLGPGSLAVLLLASTPARAQSQCQLAKLVPSNPANNQAFGISIAIHDDTCAIGAPWIAQTILPAGVVYVLDRDNGVWIESAKIAEPEPIGTRWFGRSVGIHADLIVVGSPGDKSVYGYARKGAEWISTFQTQAIGSVTGDQFGYAMAFDGTRIIVGAIGDKTKGGLAGAAYVFRVDGENCVQEAKLLASDGSAGDEFGKSVAIDGNRAIVGAWDDDPVGAWNSGSAYIFERSETGQWTEVAKVFPSIVGTLDRFGTSVAIRGDEAFVGAIGSGSIDFGAVYVFQCQANGSWLETQKLVHENAQNSDRLGRSVAVEANVLVAGAFQADTSTGTTGMLVVFERSQFGFWQQSGIAYADGGKGELGTNVALSGELALCGLLEDAPNGIESGSAYLFAVGPDLNNNGLMDPCECPGDLNKDWIVDQADLGLLLGLHRRAGLRPFEQALPGRADRLLRRPGRRRRRGPGRPRHPAARTTGTSARERKTSQCEKGSSHNTRPRGFSRTAAAFWRFSNQRRRRPARPSNSSIATVAGSGTIVILLKTMPIALKGPSSMVQLNDVRPLKS